MAAPIGFGIYDPARFLSKFQEPKVPQWDELRAQAARAPYNDRVLDTPLRAALQKEVNKTLLVQLCGACDEFPVHMRTALLSYIHRGMGAEEQPARRRPRLVHQLAQGCEPFTKAFVIELLRGLMLEEALWAFMEEDREEKDLLNRRPLLLTPAMQHAGIHNIECIAVPSNDTELHIQVKKRHEAAPSNGILRIHHSLSTVVWKSNKGGDWQFLANVLQLGEIAEGRWMLAESALLRRDDLPMMSPDERVAIQELAAAAFKAQVHSRRA